ncbi:pyridine nucleotide transhydrogenase, putative [Plasmodium malariae]|uniref:proton-translocating NAD(P)(+) transhydrogenase n=1 Tax=Plasmodium malariae TaxID=5858 RepID=A0A1D3SQ82_PLAMA|nr:pyridine nucleotide transhydrogenase, putative [Plasmodium malariae]SCO94038.1 pyridine nucleotide transhydrogenase, putative [Plasmodium malariae]
MRRTILGLLIFTFYSLIAEKANCKLNLRNSLKNYYNQEDNNNNNSNNFQIKLPIVNFPPNNSNKGNHKDNEDNNIDYSMINNKNYERYGKARNASGWDADQTELSSYSFVPSLLNAVYLFSSLCFILCLTGLNDHKTSKRGNVLGFIGIVAAILVTFSQVGFGFRYELFLLIVIPAIIIGLCIAHYVSMIQLPQLVALFHSFVGLAALFVGFSKYHSESFEKYGMSKIHLIELFLGTFIGAITFIGSLVAAGKLSGILDSKSLKLKIKKLVNIICVVVLIILGYYFITIPLVYLKTICLYISFLVELFLGFHLIASIGGADMPVVISALNSYSGFATAISGFLLHNNLLIISGSLIGSSGAILSYIMCIGMNRDIFNIILGGWDDDEEFNSQSIQDKVISNNKKKNTVNSITHKYVAENLINAKNIIIVPGYGTAVSKCQRELAEICTILKTRKINVNFAIHPVAGRMPGHLNVLLAEANIPYNIVKEMDEINSFIANADIVLVVGANDIVNPSSLDPSSKIYGMPVIDVWKAKQVIILKRSLNTGYSCIDNPLFYFPNTYMLFGDAKHLTNQILSILNDYVSHKYPEVSLDNIKMAEQESDMFSFHSLSESSQSLGDAHIDEENYPMARRIIGLVKDDIKLETDDMREQILCEKEQGKEKIEKADINLSIVPLTPKFIPKLRRMGFRILVEKDIGTSILIDDEQYKKYGGEIVSREIIFKQSNIILKVDPPTKNFINEIPNNTVLISYFWPSINQKMLEQIVENKEKNNITYLAIDEVPRSTRAQKLDVRSSMSNLQGYRAVIESFFTLPRFSKSSITAAGKINPAKVFVIGAGVAGLQAIITAKSMGAIVYSYDSRSSTEEEVKSCGGIFVKIPMDEDEKKKKKINVDMNTNLLSEEYLHIQRNLFKKIIKSCDILICSASNPGTTSPKLVTTDMIKLMKAGSVAVDLSTEFGDKINNWGGNIECSQSNKNIIINGVYVLGRDKIERNMPLQASDLFSMNMINLLEEMGGGLQFNVDISNDIIKSLVVIKGGNILYSPDKSVDKLIKSESVFISEQKDHTEDSSSTYSKNKQTVKYPNGARLTDKFIDSDLFFYISLMFVILITLLAGTIFSQSDLHQFFLFTLSIIVGYYCVWSITPSLHTPLMSVTNALSGVIIIGSMIEYGNDFKSLSSILSMIATFLSAVNLSGGFYITKRMLDMFFK